MIGLGSDKNGWKKVPLGRGRDGGVQRPMENFHFFVDPSLSLSTRLALAGKYFEMGEHLLHKKNIGWWWSPIGRKESIWRGMFSVWSCRTLLTPKISSYVDEETSLSAKSKKVSIRCEGNC